MTNLSRLVTRRVSHERSYGIKKSVHEHGMDLSHLYLVIVFESVSNVTHILQIFFGDFDGRCGLWFILDLILQWRKQGGWYDIVTGSGRCVPERASLNIL